MQLPSSWSLAGVTEHKYFIQEMYHGFPYLCLCNNDWNVLYLASRALEIAGTVVKASSTAPAIPAILVHDGSSAGISVLAGAEFMLGRASESEVIAKPAVLLHRKGSLACGSISVLMGTGFAFCGAFGAIVTAVSTEPVCKRSWECILAVVVTCWHDGLARGFGLGATDGPDALGDG